ncbi:hypothetical protein [Asaccharospora irregularis]|uniref:rRNA biogenesis protein rrp5 n=1 Tax=Asaccharospora irregularis DSM 2635 TaxID=1121321 RepID=A0A1M5R9T1_9FIRM|nr:hypothetical protein [Asaccharospora irregularis]SHH23104.1 hypothetical protein SAMN04488530_12824 [Asaccharospora irregularis DSM 2635]
MSKVTVVLDALIDVISNVRALADSLQVFADALTEIKAIDVQAVEVKEEPVAQIPEKVEKPKKEKAKVYTLEDVRGVLAEKSQNGLTAEVKGLIAKYGGSKLSDIDPKNYADIIKEAEVLGDE